MYIQVMTDEQAKNMPYNPFDLTKVWYKGEFPLIEVGYFELNRNPEKPNSYGEWQEQPDFKEPPLTIDGAAARWNFREDDDDYYTQPGKLFRLMNPEQQKALFENTARALDNALKDIKLRHIGNCMKAGPAYGTGVADALGLSIYEIK